MQAHSIARHQWEAGTHVLIGRDASIPNPASKDTLYAPFECCSQGTEDLSLHTDLPLWLMGELVASTTPSRAFMRPPDSAGTTPSMVMSLNRTRLPSKMRTWR